MADEALEEVVAQPKKGRRPKPASGEAWGILNPFGDLWSYDTFRTPEAAMAHVEAFWRGMKNADTSRFTPIRVKVTVSVAPRETEGKG